MSVDVAKFQPDDAVATPMGDAVVLHSRPAAGGGTEYFVRGRRSVEILGTPTMTVLTEWWREDQLERVE